ncbi:hypothetical protein [Noviherbaspirillum galbum]|uniref:Uncharacterized protein n=1 Tax=Noviherbaspirillum galbum TaxID=2709383 RepID=A0A6B3SMZ5_9BURK|nr:hypothetical protein [Noviherbaspirillum galbum]NEX60116.1 hypothetical protein [Noviherbaspirillum galbum]
MAQGRKWVVLANKSIATKVATMSEAAREHFEERAGMLEFEGGMARAAAELLALEQTEQVFGKQESAFAF